MYIYNLVIEVTRKCNMACEHCLRGDAQNKDLDTELIRKFFIDNEVESILDLTFTGGEPSLNIDAIRAIMDICKDLNVEIANFYIATNAKKVTDEFIKVCMDLYLMCTDNEVSSVHISRDDYHIGQDADGIERLKCLRFVSEKDYLDNQHVIAEGRGKELAELNGTIDRARRISVTQPDNIDEFIQETIYINVNGDILNNCDLSYARQTKNKLGNVKTHKLSDIAQPQE